MSHGPRAAATARSFIAEQCASWGLEGIRDDLILPVSELVTNAVVHAGTSARVTVSLAGRLVEVAVQDGNHRRPIMRPARVDLLADIDRTPPIVNAGPSDPRDPMLLIGESGSILAGRGLLIVDAVADEWGIAELSGGKWVWFRIRVPESWSFPSPCGCPAGLSITPGGLSLDA